MVNSSASHPGTSSQESGVETRASGVPLFVNVSVTNFGDQAVDKVPLQVRTYFYAAPGAGATADRPTAKVDESPMLEIERIEPGETVTQRVQVYFPEAGKHVVEAVLPDDAVAADNRRSLDNRGALAETTPSSLRASSGSRSAMSSIESLVSAKSTVTCLRSPSSVSLEVRIFSARCRGVYDPGEAKRGPPAGAPPTGCAHSRQNLAAAGSGAPQASHRALSGAPHPRQNFASCGFAVRHRRHVIGVASG